jgi:lipopolysaccharide transport system ATP-binding protein
LPTSSNPPHAVVSLTQVSKRYDLQTHVEVRRLFERFLSRSPATKQAAAGVPAESGRYRYALRDVTLSLEAGESLGVIGRNGAGKSTLLRLLAGVTLPTTGRVRVEGRVAALIGLAIGFHFDLTGRENAHLYCSLMGFDRRSIPARVEQILAFAEIGDYVDVAFKRYSTGMMARLGFAAAICTDPGILLLDEVLAVGDQAFYMKSHAALSRLAAHSTVVFVSHNLDAVPEFCRRAIWIEQGRIMADGPARDVVRRYRDAQGGPAPQPTLTGAHA